MVLEKFNALVSHDRLVTSIDINRMTPRDRNRADRAGSAGSAARGDADSRAHIPR